MLDENLPVFFLRPSTTGIPHHSSLYLSHRGSEPEPSYSLQYLDPASPSQAHKNCYAAALFDAHIAEVLFGEVLVRPAWTQPTLSQDDIRRNGGVPPPPEPRVPSSFNIQLYNPEQQVTVQVKEGKWGSSDTYEFSIPERTFRAPSASNLDRGQSDPGSLDTTPRIKFVWKRESKLSKDLTCFMTGKSTDTEKKKSRRDPDIAIALWRNLREMTLYESNMNRIDTEDPKGLEVTLLLSAIVLKDLFFSSKERVHEMFNIQSAGASRSRTSSQTRVANAPVPHPSPRLARRDDLQGHHNNNPPLPDRQPLHAPPPDPREKWQIEAETARLRQVADSEAREAHRQRREREKAEELERRRLQKIVDQEQKEARRKADEVDKETERLRRLYGVEGQMLQPGSSMHQQEQPPRRSFQGNLQTVPQGRASSSSGRPDFISDTVVMSGANPSAGPAASPLGKKKKSFFGLRSVNDDLTPSGSQGRLSKKQSAMW